MEFARFCEAAAKFRRSRYIFKAQEALNFIRDGILRAADLWLAFLIIR